MAPKRRKIPNFIPLQLRVFVEGSPNERSVIESLNLWDWWMGENEGLTQDELEAISGIAVRTLRRLLPGMKSKGWVVTSRGKFGGATRYSVSVEDMPWQQAYLVLKRRSDTISARLAEMMELQLGLFDKTGAPFRPNWPTEAAKLAGPNIKRPEQGSDLKTEIPAEPVPIIPEPVNPQKAESPQEAQEQPKASIGHRETVDAFCVAYLAKFRIKCTITGRDGKALKALREANAITREEWDQAQAHYLDTVKPFLSQMKHALWVLCDNFNEYAGGVHAGDGIRAAVGRGPAAGGRFAGGGNSGAPGPRTGFGGSGRGQGDGHHKEAGNG